MPTIYKYREDDTTKSRSKIWDILRQRRLWLSSPLSFEDKSDMQLPITGLFDTPLKVAENRMVKISLRLDPAQDPRVVRHDVRLAFLDGEMLKDLQNSLGQGLLDAVRRESGVVCFGATADNAYLWKKYGGNSSGICFGFNSQRLGCKADPIEYVRELRTIRYFEASRAEIRRVACLTKRVEYRAEEEFRIIVPKRANTALSFPKDALTSITLGPAVDLEARNQIITFAKRKFPKTLINS